MRNVAPASCRLSRVPARPPRYLEANRAQIQQLTAQIDEAEEKLNRLVYELYGLSDEEIRLV